MHAARTDKPLRRIRAIQRGGASTRHSLLWLCCIMQCRVLDSMSDITQTYGTPPCLAPHITQTNDTGPR